jgi:hypothetical protein
MERIDLDTSRSLCEAFGSSYDERAVRLVAALERLLVPRHGPFGAVFNTIEYMVEDCSANPRVISHLCDALVTLAEVHHLAPATMNKLNHTLRQLQDHVSASPRR